MMRSPIVTLAGHIDHGKTSILDSICKTAFAEKEAGFITQKISFVMLPYYVIKKKCSDLLEKYKIKVKIPGFLFIDTPGHAAFTNLRKRGGALADLAVLVVDMNEGIMAQTRECIEILKTNKIPFVVALNKVDKIVGWTKRTDDVEKNLKMQSEHTKKDFENKFYKIISDLSFYKYDADLFFRIKDFGKQLALVPCSGKTSEGISELLIVLCGLSQKFLAGKLKPGKIAKGNILEIRKEKVFWSEGILYDGSLTVGDRIFVASFEEPIEAKIRAIFQALPLGKGFESVKKVNAACGIRMQLVAEKNIAAGMPFSSAREEVLQIQREIAENIRLEKEGILVKADCLGSLEAVLFMLKKENIGAREIGIGSIGKNDVMFASSANELDKIIIGFNVGVDEEAEKLKEQVGVEIVTSAIIYELIEKLKKWREEKQQKILAEKIGALRKPCKIRVLKYVFRQSKPAIFGVHVEQGTLSKGILMNMQGKKIDEIKSLQIEKQSVDRAEKGKDVAVSLPTVTFGRQVKEGEILYSMLTEDEFKKLVENKKYLSSDEILLLEEIAKIMRKKKITWGI